MRCLAALLACSLLPLPAAAQRTWIVDAANGPGTDFTDVPLAVQAASHGDTLIVRSGNYTTATTNKGISLIGEAGASFTLSQQVLPFVVRFLPAGRTFVLKGFTVTQPSQSLFFGSVLSLSDNQGRVHLDRVTVSMALHWHWGYLAPGLSVHLRGVPIVFQALSGQGLPDLGLSTPVVVVLD